MAIVRQIIFVTEINYTFQEFFLTLIFTKSHIVFDIDGNDITESSYNMDGY